MKLLLQENFDDAKHFEFYITNSDQNIKKMKTRKHDGSQTSKTKTSWCKSNE